MNSFMNAIYNAVGSQVRGFYKNEPFVGTITTTRPMYGMDIQVGVTVPGDLKKEVDNSTGPAII